MVVRKRHRGIEGPLGLHREALASELAAQGYAQRTISFQLQLVGQLSRWLVAENLTLAELTAEHVESFERFRRRKGDGRPHELALTPILGYLRRRGEIPEVTPTAPAGPVEELLQRYARYLAGERGVGKSTVVHYTDLARLFLRWREQQHPELDLANLQAAEVIGFVEMEARNRSVGYVQHLVTALRSLLRFLHLEGRARPLAEAVPAVAGWRGLLLPRGLTSEQVAQVLNSCGNNTVTGRRDRAILTLLARLGLRAGEVAGLELEHFDWPRGEVVILGKGGRQERLPLPAEVGEAVAGYILGGRPSVKSGKLFYRVLAPVQALSVSGVRVAVRYAFERAGLKPVGAHCFRHGVATQTLAAGASLPEVGQLLRHRHLSSTAIYAKVDRQRLRELVRPWPGAVA